MITDFKLTHQKGGRREFEKTGKYPEYLVFHSPALRRTWRVKLREKPQQGILKMKGVNTFEYFLMAIVERLEK